MLDASDLKVIISNVKMRLHHFVVNSKLFLNEKYHKEKRI